MGRDDIGQGENDRYACSHRGGERKWKFMDGIVVVAFSKKPVRLCLVPRRRGKWATYENFCMLNFIRSAYGGV